MRIIITGAGELGRLLASTLCAANHEIVIIDSDLSALEHISEKLDIKIVEGSSFNIEILKQAAISRADALLAVSGDEAINVLTCQIASRLGVKKTICRIASKKYFSPDDGLTPQSFGIWKCISPAEESVEKILAVLRSPILLETIRFSKPDAIMNVIRVLPGSPLSGIKVRDVRTVAGALNSVRFAAIARGKYFLIPYGETILETEDKVYIAGNAIDLENFVQKISPKPKTSAKSRIVIAGASVTGKTLAAILHASGYQVRIIDKNYRVCEKLPGELPSGIMVLHGDPTDEEVLEEVGIQECYGFVSCAADDEDNILSCLIAKRLGAGKTITLSSKPEYIRIVPTMAMVDCGFSSTLASVNSILRMLEGGTMRIDAYLQMYHARITEFQVTKNSPICDKPLAECHLPIGSLFALAFRGDEIIAPNGSTVFLPGDVVVAIVTPELEKELEPIFPKKSK